MSFITQNPLTSRLMSLLRQLPQLRVVDLEALQKMRSVCILLISCIHKFDHHCIWINNCIG